MDTPKVVRQRLYYGIEGERWQGALARLLERVEGDERTSGPVTLDALATTFRLPAAASRAFVEGMVRDGFLERASPHAVEYQVTERMRAYAGAPLVDPLSRRDVDAIVQHSALLARHFNRGAADNRYEIDVLVVCGAYMDRSATLSEIPLGVVLRRRPAAPKPLLGRAQQQNGGHDRIRTMLARQHEFVRVTFFKALADVPRPFQVAFRADD